MPTSTSTCSASRSPTARRSAAPSRRACSTQSAASRSACAAAATPPTISTGRASLGFRVVQAEECWHKSLTPLMAEVRAQMGDGPVYLTFDIDSLDPGFAPGTGTPEIGGLTTVQALEIVRGCRGLNLVGGDWSRSRRPTTPPAIRRSPRLSCSSRCSACCRASSGDRRSMAPTSGTRFSAKAMRN